MPTGPQQSRAPAGARPEPATSASPGELRQDPLTGRWVVIASGRASRPDAFARAPEPQRGPAGCPFCLGNEHLTPPELWADRSPDSSRDGPGWRVRVVPNKFPAFAGPGTPSPDGGFYRSAPAAGAHEVIVHNPKHDATLADLELDEVVAVLAAYRERLALRQDTDLGAVIVIVNQGRPAGASLEHPHSQVFATALRPELVQAEMDRLAGPGCAACGLVARERGGSRAVADADGLLTLCPWASSSPYEALVLPVEHRARFEEEGDLVPIARAFQQLLRRLHSALGAAPYNLVLHTAPPRVRDFHWHLHLLPRLTTYGGFELATGTIVNVVDPDRAATALREAPA